MQNPWIEKAKYFENLYEEESNKNVQLMKQLDELKRKDIPQKVKTCIEFKDRIAGYCPACEGTVDIRLTALIKIKGHRCSWCGQAIDLTGVELKQWW